jgi:hypothetical protein
VLLYILIAITSCDFGSLLDPDPQVGRAAQDVRRYVHAALFFRKRDARRVPAFGKLARVVVDRQAEIVAQFGARDALWKVFVVTRLPDTRQVGLRCRRRNRCRQGHRYDRGR